ncbi:MAG: DUF1573 domain-containing protein [Fimbriiglobus sp.]
MRQLFSAMVAVALMASSSWASDLFLEKEKDFGTSPRGPILTHQFPVKNTTNEVVVLSNARVSCGCVSAQVSKAVLNPGESSSVIAYMDTKRIPQANTSKTVVVFVTVQRGNIIEEAQMRVTAIARDDLVISPDTFAFGTVRAGQGGKVTTKLTLYTDPNWQIESADSNGIYVKATTKKLPKAINEVGTSYEVTATLDPNCPVGNWVADVWVKSNAPGMNKLRIPVTVNVIAPIAVNPDAPTFGTVTAGKSSEAKVILQGSQAFKILEIKGADAELEVPTVGAAARPVHILKLTLTAKNAGDVSKKIEIVTDHPEQKTLTIKLTGKAEKAPGTEAVKTSEKK